MNKIYTDFLINLILLISDKKNINLIQVYNYIGAIRVIRGKKNTLNISFEK